MSGRQTLAEIFAEEEARLSALPPDPPEVEARRAARREAERQRHIALGWIDEDGNPGPNADPPDDEEDDEGEDA